MNNIENMENTEKAKSVKARKPKKTKDEKTAEKTKKAEENAVKKAKKTEEKLIEKAEKTQQKIAKKAEKTEEKAIKKAKKPLKVKKEHEPIDIVLLKKRLSAQTNIALTTTAAVTVGAVPIPFPDSNILVSLETGLVKTIFNCYNVQVSTELINAIIGSAAITAVAKRALNSLKAIPNIAASVINAVVAGFFVAALGESVCALSEAIISGKIDSKKIDAVTEYFTDKLSENPLLGYMIKYFLENSAKLKDLSAKEVYKIIFKSLKSAKKAEKKNNG